MDEWRNREAHTEGSSFVFDQHEFSERVCNSIIKAFCHETFRFVFHGLWAHFAVCRSRKFDWSALPIIIHSVVYKNNTNDLSVRRITRRKKSTPRNRICIVYSEKWYIYTEFAMKALFKKRKKRTKQNVNINKWIYIYYIYILYDNGAKFYINVRSLYIFWVKFILLDDKLRE